VVASLPDELSWLVAIETRKIASTTNTMPMLSGTRNVVPLRSTVCLLLVSARSFFIGWLLEGSTQGGGGPFQGNMLEAPGTYLCLRAKRRMLPNTLGYRAIVSKSLTRTCETTRRTC